MYTREQGFKEEIGRLKAKGCSRDEKYKVLEKYLNAVRLVDELNWTRNSFETC